MMTKSFKMQSTRIALCTVLLLGMALPAYASRVGRPVGGDGQRYSDDMGQKSNNKSRSCCNPLKHPWRWAWGTATLIALCLTVMAIFGAAYHGDGGNSLLWQITGASLLGAFAIGGAIHFCAVKRVRIETGEKIVVLNQKEDGSVSMYERARKSKSFWFALWCGAIATVCVVFIVMHISGAGNWDFGGPGQGVNLKALLPLLIGTFALSSYGIFETVRRARKNTPPSAPVEQNNTVVGTSQDLSWLTQENGTLIRRRLTTLQLVLRDLEETH